MKPRRPYPIIERLIRIGCRPSPQAVEATNRAIDAVLGKPNAPLGIVRERNLRGEVEQAFKDARKGET